MKIYIAGKITGDENYRAKFKAAEDSFTSYGNIVLNPAELPEGMGYEDYMTICYAMIEVADHVWFLKDWIESPGAKREHEYALRAGKEISYEGE